MEVDVVLFDKSRRKMEDFKVMDEVFCFYRCGNLEAFLNSQVLFFLLSKFICAICWLSVRVYVRLCAKMRASQMQCPAFEMLSNVF